MHMENVRVGTYVVVLNDLREFLPEQRPRPTMSGVPHRVMAVDIPFAILRAPDDSISSIDLRDFELKRVGKRFWDVYDQCFDERDGNSSGNARAASDEVVRCIRCSTKMHQQSIGQGRWVYKCPNCGSQGEEVRA